MKKSPAARAGAETETDSDIQGIVDVVIVGAGPAGLCAAGELKKQSPESTPLVIEAGDRTGGRSQSGLHLLPAPFATNPYLKTGEALAPIKIRWEKSWVSPSEVNWADKDWVAKLPQWHLYFEKAMVPLFETVPQPEGINLKTSAPVSKLLRSTDTATDGWQIETPKKTFIARKVIWAAGLTAFQNAVGKIESQSYLVGNPLFDTLAADYRGGISLTLTFSRKPNLESSFPEKSVFGLPVRHNGKYHLIIGACASVGDAWILQTLTHVHRDILSDPGEVLSFQKSLRRALKTLFMDGTGSEAAEKGQERWVVSDRVGGHAFGSAWLFGSGIPGSLDFVGDECQVSCSKNIQDTSGVLEPLVSK